jgi:hypothetical protein
MAIRITCINKAGGQHYDPHSAITYLGWINPSTNEKGKSTRLVIYDWLKTNSENRAFVLDRNGNKAYLYPRVSANGTKFVQTYADRVWTDNLLALPECVE